MSTFIQRDPNLSSHEHFTTDKGQTSSWPHLAITDTHAEDVAMALDDMYNNSPDHMAVSN